MRKVILNLAVTLDGFIEGPNGEVDWCIMDEDMDFGTFLAGIDSIFYGRVSYDAWGTYQPNADTSPEEVALWKAIHSKKKYVFSSVAQTGEAPTYISTDLASKVAAIKSQNGKDIWLYGGAGLIKTFLDLDLIDVYQLSVHPTVLGHGKPLFENLKSRIDLKLIETRVFKSGVVALSYVKS